MSFRALRQKDKEIALFTEEPRTPTHIWLEAKIRELSAQGIGVYVVHKGEKMGGLVLLKLCASRQECKLLTQQRNLDNVMEWVDVFTDEVIQEQKADEYIARSIGRDPDLWVLEIEGKDMANPFLKN